MLLRKINLDFALLGWYFIKSLRVYLCCMNEVYLLVGQCQDNFIFNLLLLVKVSNQVHYRPDTLWDNLPCYLYLRCSVNLLLLQYVILCSGVLWWIVFRCSRVERSLDVTITYSFLFVCPVDFVSVIQIPSRSVGYL